MDEDINSMTRESLQMEILKLRTGIRKHRDSTGHELCWWHPELWSLLPESQEIYKTVPAKNEFLKCCEKYYNSILSGNKL